MPRNKKSEPIELIDALRANLQLLGELAVRYEVSANAQPKAEHTDSISCSSDVFAILRDEVSELAQEQFHVLLLDTRNHLVGRRVIYQGTVNECLIRPAEVLRPAVEEGVPNLIVVHNHPSHDPTPSPEDIRATADLQRACKLLGVKLLDHIVIGGDRHISIKDLGHIDD